MQRKLMFYVTRTDNQFKLGVVQIDLVPEERDQSMPPWLRSFFFRHIHFLDSLYNDLGRLNQLKDYSEQLHAFHQRYWISADFRTLRVIDPCDRNALYGVKLCAYALPTDTKSLLAFLLALDTSVHTQKSTFHTRRAGMVIEHCQTPPDLTKLPELCHYALAHRAEKDCFPSEHLTRYVANYMVAELSRELDQVTGLNPHESLLTVLKAMLASEGSLTPMIRQHLYPVPTVSEQIAACCGDADELTKKLLNPECPLEAKTQQLFAFIRKRLWAKPDLPKNGMSEDGQAVKEWGRARQRIHCDLTAWFQQLAVHQKALWRCYLHTLDGKLADDQGFYNDGYTEIVLLAEARIVNYPNGLLGLEFSRSQGSSYHKHYAVNQKLHDKLGDELRAACGDMDLHFLPNQDFHATAIFDVESSRLLRARGYHFDEVYCKEQMRLILAKQQFRQRAVGAGNLFVMLPPPMLGVIMEWVNVLHRAEVRQRHEEEEAERGQALQGAIRLS